MVHGMGICDIWNDDLFITEIDAEHHKIKANTKVNVVTTDGEDYCVIQDENGIRDLIDFEFLERC